MVHRPCHLDDRRSARLLTAAQRVESVVVLVELHCHTTASDGAYAPAELVALAKQHGISLLAITDHDTIEGCAEAIEAGQQHRITVISGIEISALSAHGEVHILGYGIHPQDSATRERIASLRHVRVERAKRMLTRLEALGIHLDFERVRAIAGDGVIGRPHIARAMVEAGFVPSIQAAFDLYLAEGKPAFAPHVGLTPVQAVELIHAAGGVAVLAHPGLYQSKAEALMEELLAVRLDGIEAHYPLHTPEQIAHFSAFAHERGLLITGGSDYHGPLAEGAALGSVQLPPAELQAFQQRLRVSTNQP